MNALFAQPLLGALADLARTRSGTGPLHLVGGAVRDALLGAPAADFDFTAQHDPTPLAHAFAGQCGGHWFWLDAPRRQSRVLIGALSFDFAPWRAGDLAGDLAARDFTVNAMALDMAEPLTRDRLIDPLGGAGDLAGRLLRLAGPRVLNDDPLRVLKGVRHVAELGFAVAPATLTAMRAAAGALPDIAPERVRCEIWRILVADGAGAGLDALHDCGAGAVLFGANFAAALDAMHGALARSASTFALLRELAPRAGEWLGEPVEQHLDRAGLLVWWSVLGAIDRGLPLRLARRWRFSRAATARLAALDRLRPQLWPELLALPRRPRPVALWALQQGPDPVDPLIALALRTTRPAEESARHLVPLLAQLAALDDPRRIPPLVDGTWLSGELGLAGEAVGAAQQALRQAEIAGEVATTAEAHDFLHGKFGERD